MMRDIESLRAELGDYAKDIHLNLSSVLREDPNTGLTQGQIQGIALAAAYATRQNEVTAAIMGTASAVLTAEEIQAAKAAATIMAMNNVYYRFVHLSEDKEFARMPAGLRMNIIANSGIDKTTFELYSLAVSAINGCGMCIESHAAAVQREGISKAGVQHCVRIAAVVFATAQAIVIR